MQSLGLVTGFITYILAADSYKFKYENLYVKSWSCVKPISWTEFARTVYHFETLNAKFLRPP